MNGDGQFPNDEQVLTRLGDALGYDPQREPPPARVAALRAAAEEARGSQLSAHGEARSQQGRTTSTVVHMPRRRALLLGGIAASMGAVAGFGGRGLLATGLSSPVTEPIAFSSAPPGVQANARLINHTWGVELLLDVSGLPDGQTYRVVYNGVAGAATDAGSFLSVAGTLMECRFNAAALRTDVAAITVLDASDVEVLRADLA